MELTQVQLWLAITLASTLVWLIKQATKWFPKWQPGKIVLSWLVYVVSLGLAFYYTAFTLPVWIPPVSPFEYVSSGLRWVSELITSLGPIAGSAMLFYTTIWQKFLEGTAGVVNKYVFRK